MLMLGTSLWLCCNLFHHPGLLTPDEKIYIMKNIAYETLKEVDERSDLLKDTVLLYEKALKGCADDPQTMWKMIPQTNTIFLLIKWMRAEDKEVKIIAMRAISQVFFTENP